MTRKFIMRIILMLFLAAVALPGAASATAKTTKWSISLIQ
jgi:hypothetical protein